MILWTFFLNDMEFNVNIVFGFFTFRVLNYFSFFCSSLKVSYWVLSNTSSYFFLMFSVVKEVSHY